MPFGFVAVDKTNGVEQRKRWW